MKKALFILLAVSMLFSLASCRGIITDDSHGNDTATEAPETAELLSPETVHIYPLTHTLKNGEFTSFTLSTLYKDITFSARQLENTDIKIFVEDLTGDGYPDVAAVFVNGMGTGMHCEEIHIFDGRTLKEYHVEDMSKTLSSHVSISSDDTKYTIKTANQTYLINKSSLETEPENLFDNLSIDFIYEYTVSNGAVHYKAKCKCGMGEFCGTLDATLRFFVNGFAYDKAVYLDEKSNFG